MTDRTMPDAHPLRSGDPARLGVYRLLGRLGEGGQGSIFLGRPTAADGGDAGDYVAVKLLHAGLTAEPAARARFVRELEVAKRVARFCTAQILDADVAGDLPYIVSEYVPGRSLQHLVQAEGPRSGGALERLAISTLTALVAIHQAGIVHRDFKPHNVMMGPDGPRVIDFGVARALGGSAPTQNVGTPSYMAPEQFNGGEIGPATDLFAWGTTMVFAATGKPAFGNDEIGAVMHRILHDEADLSGLPDELREVVAACLAKDPAHRPTARQAQERLVGADSTQPVQPWPAAPPSMETRQETRQEAAPPVPPPMPAPAVAHPVPVSPGPSHAEVQQGGHPRPGPFVPGGPGAGFPQPGQSGQAEHPGLGQTVPQPGGRSGAPRYLIPAVAAVAVAALLIGGSVWIAMRSAGGKDSPEAAGVTESTGERPGSGGQQGGVAAGQPSQGASRSPGVSPTPGKPTPGSPNGGSTTPGQPRPTPNPTTTKPGGGGGGGGGGGSTPTPEPKNPYTAQQVCNSGGHGGGYYIQRSSSFSGGTVYQLYNSSGYNCAVTLKTKSVGKKTSVWARIEGQNGKKATDSGSYAYYAGPVYVSAKGVCVRYAGGSSSSSTSAGWANCG